MLAFALVSMNLIPYSSASWQQETKSVSVLLHDDPKIINRFLCYFYQVEFIVKYFTFSPLSLDTCRLSLTSHLFPRTILSTSAEACCGRKFGIVNTQEINQHKVFSDLLEDKYENKSTKKWTHNKWTTMFLQAKNQQTHSQTHSLILHFLPLLYSVSSSLCYRRTSHW